MNKKLVIVGADEFAKIAYEYFSFGFSTDEHGKIHNKMLALFKEGFGSNYSINRSYYQKI